MDREFIELLAEDVKGFLYDVTKRTKGYDVYLGGGMLRDIYFNYVNNMGDYRYPEVEGGKVPKDIDIFFIPNDEVHKELPTIPQTYINYDVPAVDIKNCRENVERVRGLFCKQLGQVKDIQFIVYDRYLTIKQLAEDMDCNCNQVMYCPRTEEVYMTDAFTDSHSLGVIEMMHEFEPERMFSRIMRMKAKFPSYEIKHNIDEKLWLELKKKAAKEDKLPRSRRRGGGGSFIHD